METYFKKLTTLVLLFFSLAYARAGFIPTITAAPACHGNDGTVIFSNLQSDGPGPFTVQLVSYYNGFNSFDSVIVASSDTIRGLAAGKYWFLVAQNSNYSNTVIYDTITVPSVVNINPTITNTTCPANNGSISVTVTGGTGSYTYLWSTHDTGTSITGVAGGNYILTVTDAGGCSAILDTFVYSSSPVSVSIADTGSACNPTLTASTTGSTGFVVYHWSTGDTTASITGLSNYTYYEVTASDAHGCSAYQYTYLGLNALQIDSSAAIGNTACGNNSGSVSISMYNGTRPFSYHWSNSGTDSVITGLSSGYYNVTVTDAGGCSAAGTYYVGQASNLSLDSTVFIYPTCAGGLGSITVRSINGTAPFSYLWSNGATTAAISGLIAGQYNVTVTDAHGCRGYDSYYLYTDPLNGYIYTLAPPSACGTSDGSIAAYAYGGTSSYSYLWSTGATGSSLSNIPAGFYSVTVTDISTGCTTVFTDTLQSGSGLAAYFYEATNPSCGASDGNLAVSGYNGSGSYTYYWSTGSTSDSIFNLPAGIYYVTVTDTGAGGCSTTNAYQLVSTGLQIDSFIGVTYPATCSDSNGSIQPYLYNGVAPFTYLWSTGSTDSVLNGLYSGVFSVTVTDHTGCTGTQVFNVNPYQLAAYVYANYNPTCNVANGEIEGYGYGGSGVYTYLWSTGSRDSVLSNIAAGQYTLTVYDGSGCASSVVYNLLSASLPVDSSNGYTVDPNCNQNNGAIYVQMQYGIPPYSFSWSTGATDSIITGLAAGSYEVTVTDSAGCTGVGYYYLYQSYISAYINVLASPTCTASNGVLQAEVSGGSGAYTYDWSDHATSETVSGASAGLYTLTVTDTTGCIATDSAYIIAVSSLQLDSNTLTYPDCHGNTGAITAEVANGTPPYLYHWSTSSTDSTISGLAPGQWYSVTVTDAGGCSGTDSYYLYQNLVGVQLNYANNPTCSDTDGYIEVYAYGGNGIYTYQWSNGASAYYTTNLGVGIYTVTATDGSGCSATYTDSLTASNPLQAYIYNNNNPTCGNSDGYIYAEGYNGSGNYTYLWSNGGTGDSIINVPAGTYTVTVSDGTSCSTTSGLTLVGQGNYQIIVTTTPTACNTAINTGSATAIVSGGGTAPFTFSWTAYIDSNGFYTQENFGNQQTISNLPYGTILYVNVTDSNGCTSTTNYDSTQIQYDSACYDHIIGYVFLDSDGNCIPDRGEAGVTGAYVSASDGQQFFWANPDSTGFYDIEVVPGTYTVVAYLYSYGPCSASTCVSQYIDTFTTSGEVSSGNNFAVSTGASFDLGVHPGCYPSTPGSQKEYWIYYYNNGIQDAGNAVVSFTFDTNLTLISTSPAYSSFNPATHVITWNVGTVPGATGYFNWTQITMQFQVSDSVSLGQILFAQAEIDPIAGDCDPSDNIVNFSDVVTASHDPNEKIVSPAGNLSASDSVLTYTIRFQNTGDAPAHTIVISDTLSPYVNPATVVPGAASFMPYKYTLSGNGVITFTFQGINLPDSSHGSSSIGFVTYTVHTKPQLPLGTQIDNTAYVYFDANPAVITNTTVNTRSNSTGVVSISNSKMTAQVVPNPAHDIALIEFTGATGTISLEITDELGQIISVSEVDTKSYTLDAEALATGIYFYTAKDAIGNKASGKISIVH